MSDENPATSVRMSDAKMFVRVEIAEDLIISDDPERNPFILFTEQEARDLARDIRMALRDMAEARRR